MRKNGENKPCDNCGVSIYLPKSRLKRAKNTFCSKDCYDKHQSRNKIVFDCKICGEKFSLSKGEVEKATKRGHKKLYCSLVCRNNDKHRMTEKAQAMNEVQRNKTGPNKLELAGRHWLTESLGFIKDVDFKEQVLMFDKFCVDVAFVNIKLIVQFDGEYWHQKPKRKKLDESQDAYLNKCGYTVFRVTDKEMYCKDGYLNEEIILGFTSRYSECVLQNVMLSK